MTDTTRDLIQRLTDALAEWQLGGAPPEDTSDADLINEARAYLSQPEPEDKVLARVEFAKRDFNGPSDAILARYCDYWFYSDPERTEVDPVDLCRGAIKLFAHYALSIPPATEKL